MRQAPAASGMGEGPMGRPQAGSFVGANGAGPKRGLYIGANEASPKRVLGWPEWGKPQARSGLVGLGQRPRRHETLQPAAAGMQLAPALSGEIDHRQPGRR